MTHSEIYTKFMIEYDKANVTSSYPSLTKYEIATILDKAYLALIAQKFTGNNYRQVAFEGDIKNIEDLRPLVVKTILNAQSDSALNMSTNDVVFQLPDQLLYYVKSDLHVDNNYSAIDDQDHVISPVDLVSHESAEKFMNSTYNLPWIKNPAAIIQGEYIHVFYDTYENQVTPDTLQLVYIEKPVKFTTRDETTTPVTIGTTFDITPQPEFELSDSMAEELINLAIIMAAESVESPRMTSKINERPLES